MLGRYPLVLASICAVTATALLAAGCGGSRPPGVAGISSSTTSASAPQVGLVAFARCMRSRGVAGFPDPNGSGEIPKLQVVAAAQANPATFDAAQAACVHLAPDGSLAPQPSQAEQRTRLADQLSFARCMRSHGLSRFPDPTPQGELSVEMVQAQGIDVHSPQVLRVARACLPASHGGLTMAKIEEAIDRTGHWTPEPRLPPAGRKSPRERALSVSGAVEAIARAGRRALPSSR